MSGSCWHPLNCFARRRRPSAAEYQGEDQDPSSYEEASSKDNGYEKVPSEAAEGLEGQEGGCELVSDYDLDSESYLWSMRSITLRRVASRHQQSAERRNS